VADQHISGRSTKKPALATVAASCCSWLGVPCLPCIITTPMASLCAEAESIRALTSSGNLAALVREEMPMTLVLLMAFEISVALALGFVLGRIYQIRLDEQRDGFTLPPTARIPRA
jgi:hypothetical protein